LTHAYAVDTRPSLPSPLRRPGDEAKLLPAQVQIASTVTKRHRIQVVVVSLLKLVSWEGKEKLPATPQLESIEAAVSLTGSDPKNIQRVKEFPSEHLKPNHNKKLFWKHVGKN
jgi:hypothetical protein